MVATFQYTLQWLSPRGSVTAFPAKYVPSDEMTKTGHQKFWVEKLEILSKRGHSL